MIYVDENLCTGCGLCLDACSRGAISLDGPAATIDEALCTACGRCVDVCLTGAIILVETVAEADAAAELPCSDQTPLAGVPARSPQSQHLWAGTAPLFPAGSDAAAPAAASPAPASATPSRLVLAEKVLSGLLDFATYVLDRKQDRAVVRESSSTSEAAGAVRPLRGSPTGSGLGPQQVRGGCRGMGGGQGRGKGQRSGGGRGLGSGQGRGGNRCGVNKGQRST